MIDINQDDIVAVRKTVDGRFVLFTRTDIQPRWKQRFWGVILDTGADGHGTLVRYGSAGAPAGWSVGQLIQVVQARMAAEHARAPTAGALAVMEALAGATAFHSTGGANLILASATAGMATERDPAMVTFHPDGSASPYPWTEARCGDLSLPLCRDHQSRDEGIVPEQVLTVIEQMLIEWTKLSPHRRPIQQACLAAKAALEAEVARVAFVRGLAPSADPSV